VLVRWPVPIVLSPGAFVPLGVFALIFVAFSGGSKPSVLAAAALLGGVGGIVSLIVHELGHVSVAKRLAGVRPEKVSVMSLGAAAHLEGSYRNGREQARIALGGPGASFASRWRSPFPSSSRRRRASRWAHSGSLCSTSASVG
jgi:Zn-dependent protease